MTEPLTKVDSAVEGLSASPPKKEGHRRQSSTAPGVYNINDLGRFQTLCWQIWLVCAIMTLLKLYSYREGGH